MTDFLRVYSDPCCKITAAARVAFRASSLGSINNSVIVLRSHGLVVGNWSRLEIHRPELSGRSSVAHMQETSPRKTCFNRLRPSHADPISMALLIKVVSIDGTQ